MSHDDEFYHWMEIISSMMPQLSKPLVGLLALWSFSAATVSVQAPSASAW